MPFPRRAQAAAAEHDVGEGRQHAQPVAGEHAAGWAPEPLRRALFQHLVNRVGQESERVGDGD